jgi:four helix bundle protein
MQNVQCKMHNADGVAEAAVRPSVSSFVKSFDMSERFLDFADRVCSVVEVLPDTRIGRRIADQLLRSGTSPVGNYEEACGAESRRDFIHKMRVCLKEVRESRAWLLLAARRGLVKSDRLSDLIDESDQLARIVGKSIATAKGAKRKCQVTEEIKS